MSENLISKLPNRYELMGRKKSGMSDMKIEGESKGKVFSYIY
jgi:hypothetical protein